VKTYRGEFSTENVKVSGFAAGCTLSGNPRFKEFESDHDLSAIQLRQLSQEQIEIPIDLSRRTFESIPNQAAAHKLHMKFEAVDTEELKNLEISVDGTQGIFKIGEGEANHYQIPNDKKLWESQLMIVCKDGKYFIRDLGVVHTSRIKVDMNTQIQIQQDALVDLGKVVHYHFDKVTHKKVPTQEPSNTFYIMRPHAGDYAVEESHDEEQDPPTLRARPTWVSSDENKDLIQKEIILEAIDQAHYFSIGRSMKREVQIKLKAVSADHCNITYEESKGWFISESGKDKPSSNGTFVFMKSQKQMQDHEPSSLIPLHDGMVLSFINYEIRVNLEKKDAEDVERDNATIRNRAQQRMEAVKLGATLPSKAHAQVHHEEMAAAEEEHHVEIRAEKSIHGFDDVPASLGEAVEVLEDDAEEKAAIAERERIEAEEAAAAAEAARLKAEQEQREAEAAEAARIAAEAKAEKERKEAEEAEKAAAAAAKAAAEAEALAEKERAEADAAAAKAAALAAEAEKQRAEAEAAAHNANLSAAEKARELKEAEEAAAAAAAAAKVAAEEDKQADAAEARAEALENVAEAAEEKAEKERLEAEAAAAAAEAARAKEAKEEAEAAAAQLAAEEAAKAAAQEA